MRRRILIVISGLAAILVAVFLATQLGQSRDVVSPLPNPNGYDDFLKAAELLEGDYRDYMKLDLDALKKLVSSDAQSLELVRLGLTRQCAVSLTANADNRGSDLEKLAEIKKLGFFMMAENRVAEMEDRPGDAARICVETVRLGEEISRGGPLINRLVGVAVESMGHNGLTRILPKLTSEQVLPLIEEIEKIDQRYVTWEEVWQEENKFARRQFGSIKFNLVMRPIRWWMSRDSTKRVQEKHRNARADLRLLRTELALICYRAKHGKVPERLDQLVPDLLKEVPVSPLTGRPMAYQPDGTNWILNGK